MSSSDKERTSRTNQRLCVIHISRTKNYDVIYPIIYTASRLKVADLLTVRKLSMLWLAALECSMKIKHKEPRAPIERWRSRFWCVLCSSVLTQDRLPWRSIPLDTDIEERVERNRVNECRGGTIKISTKLVFLQFLVFCIAFLQIRIERRKKHTSQASSCYMGIWLIQF